MLQSTEREERQPALTVLQVAAEVAYSEHLQQQQWQAGPQMEGQPVFSNWQRTLTRLCVADLALVPPPVALTSPTSQLLHDIRQKSEASTQESLKALQKEKDALMQVPACCIELFSCCLRSLSSGTGQESEQLRKIWNDVSNS